MAKFRKHETLGKALETGIIPVFSHPDTALAKEVIRACYKGGIRVFEWTDRGEGAYEAFRTLVPFVREECPQLSFGAGTIPDAPTAALFIAEGADFIVSPALVAEIAPLCFRHGVPYIPGCGTISEISQGQALGCDIVKIFPAPCLGGPSFVRNALAPMPWSLLMATGGVEPSRENLSAWRDSGVACVGMGSRLFPEEILENADWDALAALCRDCIDWFK